MSAQERELWYYASARSERLGPVSVEELKGLMRQGVVEARTLVWSTGYADWVPAREVAALRGGTSSGVPPVMPRVAVGSEAHAEGGGVAVSQAVVSAAVAEVAARLVEEHKPRKGLFIASRLGLWLVGSVVVALFAGGILAGLEMAPWWALAVLVGGGVLGALASGVAYRKERYVVHGSRVICYRGGLASDQTTELEIRKITHVKIKLPWLRFKFFGVGNVAVKTAGTSKPVVMRLIENPEAVYAGLRDRMKENGYELTQQQLLHEERPAMIGILGECLGAIFGGVMIGFYFLGLAVELSSFTGSSQFLWLCLPVLVLVVFGGGLALRILEYRRRTYRVYSDVITYNEGFLTRENCFIPYENITDSNTKRSFVDTILNIYDVQVSCQGSNSEIKFKRMKHGEALAAAIHQLVVRARQKEKARILVDAAVSGVTRERPRRMDPEVVPVGEVLVGNFKMHAGRALVPLVFLFPLIPLWIAATIQTGIKVVSTVYSVRAGSVRHLYRFLTLHEREFVCTQITGLVIKRNLWDRVFGTMTLKFWSIGSGEPLEFAHVQVSQFDLAALQRQVGIPSASPEPYQAEASFKLLTWLRARLARAFLLLILAAASLVGADQNEVAIGYVAGVWALLGIALWLRTRAYYSHQVLKFHEHHIEAHQGLLFRRSYFVRYGNVKRCKVTRYPGGEDGSLEIYVAGEEEVGKYIRQKNPKNRLLKQCSFRSEFLPQAAQKGLLLDDILCGRVEAAPQAVPAEPLGQLMLAPRAVANAVIKLVLLSLVLLPLSALLPLTIPLTVLRARRWRYHIEAIRIVISWGIVYRHEASILLDRVDSLQQSQGPINKIVKNGNVSIMTAGSSKADLVIIDCPRYLDLYQVIREHSQKS